MQNKYKVNLSNIKYLHFYMSMIIVMYHVGGIKIENCNELDFIFSNGLICIFEFLANIAMAYFFIISGFLLFKNLDLHNYQQKIKRRIFSLFLPFLIWNFLVLILKVSVGRNQLLDFIYIFDMRKYPPNGPLWYMWCVFLLAIISPIFIKFLKKCPFLLIAIFSVLCNFILHNFTFNDGYIVNLLHFFPVWLLGSALAIKNFNYISVFFLMLISAFSFKGQSYDYVVFIIQICIILILISTHKKLYISKIDIYKYSFLMYVIHGPIIEVLGNPTKNFIFSLIGNSFATIVISKLLFLIVCLCLCKFFYFIFRNNQKVIDVITCSRG